MSVESKLCDGMGYEHCVLFSAARVAIAFFKWRMMTGGPIFVHSNICPALRNALGDPVLMPVSASNGLSNAKSIQLYGFRQEGGGTLDIDPLMTGWRRHTKAKFSIISFGYSKTIDIGYGGAILCNDVAAFKDFIEWSDWNDDAKTEQLDYELDRLDEVIKRRKERMALWDMYLPEWCIKPDIEPVMPWRVIRRIEGREHESNRDYVVELMRGHGFKVGINYPPLSGCTDPSSVKWGSEVINFFLDDDPVRAREILNRAVGL